MIQVWVWRSKLHHQTPPNSASFSNCQRSRIQCMKYLSSEVKFDLFEEYHGVKMSPRSHVPGMIHDSKALGLYMNALTTIVSTLILLCLLCHHQRDIGVTWWRSNAPPHPLCPEVWKFASILQSQTNVTHLIPFPTPGDTLPLLRRAHMQLCPRDYLCKTTQEQRFRAISQE